MFKIIKVSTFNKMVHDVSTYKEKMLFSERKKKEAVTRMKNSNRKIEKLTKLERPKLSEWAKKIREAGRCDVCNTENDLTAHHLWDKATHPSLAYEVENGVCLCKSCHIEFHLFCKPSSLSSPAKYYEFKKQKQIL